MLDRFEAEEKGAHDLDPEQLAWWGTNFPDVPPEVLRHMGGQGREPEQPPWNRRTRRTHARAKGVIINLFCGPSPKKWNGIGGDSFVWLHLDTLLGAQYSLHNPQVWAYVWGLASKGKVAAILGGPPCRTVSRMRNGAPPGPRRLRGRGEDRWHLQHLQDYELNLVNSDSALCLKQMALWVRAQECKRWKQDVCMLLESPMDPASYLKDEDEAMTAPSFWNFPEITSWLNQGGLRLIHFDQGSMGHARRKPTTILSNLPELYQLQGLRGDGHESEPLPASLSRRMDASEEWAAWAPGLVKAIQHSMTWFLSSLTLEEQGECIPQMAKLDMDAWRRHAHQGHIPFRSDCRICAEAMGCDAPHRRVGGASTHFVLSVDICGPFEAGKDYGTGMFCRYALVGTVAVPILGDLPGAGDEPCDHPEALKEVPELPELEEEIEMVTRGGG